MKEGIKLGLCTIPVSLNIIFNVSSGKKCLFHFVLSSTSMMKYFAVTILLIWEKMTDMPMVFDTYLIFRSHFLIISEGDVFRIPVMKTGIRANVTPNLRETGDGEDGDLCLCDLSWNRPPDVRCWLRTWLTGPNPKRSRAGAIENVLCGTNVKSQHRELSLVLNRGLGHVILPPRYTWRRHWTNSAPVSIIIDG